MREKCRRCLRMENIMVRSTGFFRRIIPFFLATVTVGLGLLVTRETLFEERGEVYASASQNTSGWAWSSNIGWLSFNCTNEGTCGAVDYGVNVNVPILAPFPLTGDYGDFSGYAWSSNIGWIKMSPTSTPPIGPSTPARIFFNSTGATHDVEGWVRACAAVDDAAVLPANDCEGPPLAAAGGWDGWIAMAVPGPTTGLQGYWKFNEGTGMTAADSSGNGNNGTFVGGPVWEAGKRASALRFNGTDAVGMGDDLDFEFPTPTSQFSIAAWINPSSFANTGSGIGIRTIAGKFDEAGEREYLFGVTTPESGAGVGRLRIWMSEDRTEINSVRRTSLAAIPVVQWTHVAVTIDFAIDNYLLYINGSPDTTGSGALVDLYAGTAQFRVGGAENPLLGFIGLVDEARVYNRVLTPEEITLLAADVGVRWNETDRELKGWAWGGNVVGWMSFNCENEAGCGGLVPDYNVLIDLTKPQAVSPLHTPLDQCGYGYPRERLSWTFFDADASETQIAYQIQIDDNSDFSSLAIDAACTPLCGSQIYNTPSGLLYNTTYYWRVRVWDNTNMRSNWSVGPSFTTRLHAAPQPSFTYLPQEPTKGEVVELIDGSTCYDSFNNPYSCKTNNSIRYEWDFNVPSGIDCDSGVGSPSPCRGDQRTSYDAVGLYTVLLRVTDELSASEIPPRGRCETTRTFTVSIPLPGWREISPF